MSQSSIFSATKLYYANTTGSAASGALVINVTGITGPTFTKGEVEVTSMESTALEFKPAYLNDPGVVSFTFQYVPSDPVHKALIARATATTTSSLIDLWRMDLSTGASFAFSGSVQEIALKFPDVKGIATADGKIRCTGAFVTP